MSDKPPQFRITTRSAHRLGQDSTSMQDSDASSSPSNSLNRSTSPNTNRSTSPSNSLNRSTSPNTNRSTSPSNSLNRSTSPKMELKEEPADHEVFPAGSDSGLSPGLLQAVACQVKEAMGLTSLMQNNFTGRKRKANFSNEEMETLVRDVVKHFSALYGSEALRTESTRRNQRRSQLWNQIQKNVNDLGYTPRTIDDLKHKWRDLRLEVKRKITHKKTAGTPIIDTKLTPLEELVASTIGHHCTLDGEQEGMYMEPGVPRQSIFLSCRGPNGVPDVASDRLGASASPRPQTDISLLPPLVSTSPAQMMFAPMSDEGENEEQEMEVTPKLPIKPFVDTWTHVGTLIPTPQNLTSTKLSLAPPAKKLIIARTGLLAIKQEIVPVKLDMDTGGCDSQGSVTSSPNDSPGHSSGPAESITNSSGDKQTPSDVSGDTIKLKIEDDVESQPDENSQKEDESDRMENQDDWEEQTGSPQPSENAQEDSANSSSSSQDGEPNPGRELAANGDCASPTDDPKGPWRTNMHRLLELEEHWDSMYQREVSMWEEERIQQREQRTQDRELQQQLLSVLTDIRDELRHIREERVARRNQTSNGLRVVVTPSPPARIVNDATVTKPSTETPVPDPKTSSPASTPTVVLKRTRGRPRLIKPAPASNC